MELVFIAVLILSAGGLYAVTCKHIFDAPAIYILHSLFLMIIPAAMHMFGFELDSAYHRLIDFDAPLVLLSMIVALSFAVTGLSYMLFRSFPLGASLFPSYADGRSALMMFLGVLLLSILAIAIIFIPLSQVGFNVIKAANLIRHDFFFTGASYLRQFQFFANFISGALCVYLLKRKKDGHNVVQGMIVATAGLFVLNMMTSLVLGGKTMIVFPLAFTLLAYEICVARRGYTRILLGVLVAITVTVSLQFVRSQVVQNVDKAASEHVYIGLYFVLYDSTLLYLGSDDALHETSLGEDFINGIGALVPRALWKEKPTEHITVGSRFKAQITNGQGQGGWPVYGFAQWYVNFGWAGVVIGAVLTGWILALLQRQYRDYRENPFSFMILWNMVFVVMGPWPGGVHSFFLMHYILFLVPLFIFKALSGERFIPKQAK